MKYTVTKIEGKQSTMFLGKNSRHAMDVLERIETVYTDSILSNELRKAHRALEGYTAVFNSYKGILQPNQLKLSELKIHVMRDTLINLILDDLK